VDFEAKLPPSSSIKLTISLLFSSVSDDSDFFLVALQRCHDALGKDARIFKPVKLNKAA